VGFIVQFVVGGFLTQSCSDLMQRSIFQRKTGESYATLCPCYYWLTEPVLSLFRSALWLICFYSSLAWR